MYKAALARPQNFVNIKVNSFPPNDTIWCDHGHGLSISLWEFIWGVLINTRRYTLLHDFCFVQLFLMGAKRVSPLDTLG